MSIILAQKRIGIYISCVPSNSPLFGFHRPAVINLSLDRSTIHTGPLNRLFSDNGEKAGQSDCSGSREEGAPKSILLTSRIQVLPLIRYTISTQPLAGEIIKKYRGYPSFRGEQEKVIARLQERGPTI